MADWIVLAAAIWLLVMVSLDVIIGPFLIGQKRKPYTAVSCLISLWRFVLMSIVCGRVFGWW